MKASGELIGGPADGKELNAEYAYPHGSDPVILIHHNSRVYVYRMHTTSSIISPSGSSIRQVFKYVGPQEVKA